MSGKDSERLLALKAESWVGNSAVIICPDGNLNGSNLDGLVERTVAICSALDSAIRAAEQVWPHGRDYQNSPPGVHDAHMSEANRRFAMLRELYIMYCEDAWSTGQVRDRRAR